MVRFLPLYFSCWVLDFCILWLVEFLELSHVLSTWWKLDHCFTLGGHHTAVLWNHNYVFLRFWFHFLFRLLTSSGSGSDFWQASVPVPASYLDHKKHSFQQNFYKILPFYLVSFFTGKKLISFIKFKCKMWMKIMLKWRKSNTQFLCLRNQLIKKK